MTHLVSLQHDYFCRFININLANIILTYFLLWVLFWTLQILCFFFVYINDLENQLKDVKFQLYADDTVVYLSGKDTNWVVDNLQCSINKFVNWCEVNQLTINIKKTKVMIFGSRYNIKKANNIGVSVSINCNSLQNVPSYKYLGIHLDQTLSFDYHIKSVVNNISHKLYIFSKIRRFLSINAALDIYKTMVLPYFDYGDVVFMFSNGGLLKKLDRLNVRGLKISKKI